MYTLMYKKNDIIIENQYTLFLYFDSSSILAYVRTKKKFFENNYSHTLRYKSK